MNQGFGNYFCTEAIEDALPNQQNSPKNPNHNLYAEQISGSAFTRPRHDNLKTWVYRLKPSVAHTAHFQKSSIQWLNNLLSPTPPNPMRWTPKSHLIEFRSLLDGIFHIASSGNQNHVYWYHCDQSMHQSYFGNYDAEMLFIPYDGEIELQTELGCLKAKPKQIIVIPKGINFRLVLLSKTARGYVAENGGMPFRLPELGIIGANGLAHPRHFEYPQATFESQKGNEVQFVKSQGVIWQRVVYSSLLDVVAWQGNYAPYRYDLSYFNTINSVSYDHPDPSINTVLTSESEIPGIANLDFVVFPHRWSVAEHTFRLPYFHRNVMNELMGIIEGQYDAKNEDFCPGGVSIHNAMTPHGPDQKSWSQENKRQEKPVPIDNGVAFMLESNKIWQVTEEALNFPEFQKNYLSCWEGFSSAEVSLK